MRYLCTENINNLLTIRIMTEEQKQNLLKQKAAIEEEISAIGQEAYDEHIVAGLYADLGAVNYELEDYDEAIQCYNEGLSHLEYSYEEFDPIEDSLNDGLRKIYVKKEDYKKAIKFALKSSENSMEYYLSNPEGSFTYILDLCCLYINAEDYPAAKRYLDRAAGFEYSDDEIENRTTRLDYYYFIYYYAIEDLEKAIAYGEKAYNEIIEDYGPDSKDAEYVKSLLDNIKSNQQ